MLARAASTSQSPVFRRGLASTATVQAKSAEWPAGTSKYNPYRPEPIQPPKEPRKVIVKNLKFGRLVEAASAASESAKAVLSEPSPTPDSSSTFGAGGPARAYSSLAEAGSSGGSNGRGDGKNPANALLPIVLAGAAVGSGYLYWSSSSAQEAKSKAQAYALSNEPYDPSSLQAILASQPPPSEDDPSKPMAERMEAWVKSLQLRICQALEQVEAEECLSSTSPASASEPGLFLRDSWLRKEGGEGISCVLSNGRVFEKGGVNVSIVFGKLPPPAVKAMTADHEGKFKGWYDGTAHLPFKAIGISCVIHPWNPAAPTVHFNYRYFEVEDPANPGVPKTWWFGGGSDLTPSYLFPVDAEHFHNTIASRCSPTQYRTYKAWCDKYFQIKHRGETRGIGGMFFDDLTTPPGDDKAREELFAWVRGCGEGFIESYVPIVARRKNAEYTKRMKQWQQLRRGRYVEFNLVYDRGTQFGLRTPGARIESILMSLPLTARWEYYAKLGTEENTEEAKLIEVLKNPREWATILPTEP